MLSQSLCTPVKQMIDGTDAQPLPSISSTATSPVNTTRLVHLANVAIDSHENAALDCRVDSASLALRGVSDRIKAEDAATQSSDTVAVDGRLSQG